MSPSYCSAAGNCPATLGLTRAVHGRRSINVDVAPVEQGRGGRQAPRLFDSIPAMRFSSLPSGERDPDLVMNEPTSASRSSTLDGAFAPLANDRPSPFAVDDV